MALGYLIVAVVAAAVTLFAIQNADRTAVSFLLWRREGVPVAGLILGALAAGIILAGLPLALQRWRLRARVHSLEARVRMLEGAVQERQRASLREPPRPPAPPA